MAPYNLQRRPRQLGGARGYSGCLQFAEATAQALAEIRALTGRLLGKDCPAVALWGYSQGAWYAGMAACRDVRAHEPLGGTTCPRGEKSIQDICRQENVSEVTFHRWKKQFGHMEINEARRLKELERENNELKKMLAESLLKNRILEAVCEKKL